MACQVNVTSAPRSARCTRRSSHDQQKNKFSFSTRSRRWKYPRGSKLISLRINRRINTVLVPAQRIDWIIFSWCSYCAIIPVDYFAIGYISNLCLRGGSIDANHCRSLCINIVKVTRFNKEVVFHVKFRTHMCCRVCACFKKIIPPVRNFNCEWSWKTNRGNWLIISSNASALCANLLNGLTSRIYATRDHHVNVPR